MIMIVIISIIIIIVIVIVSQITSRNTTGISVQWQGKTLIETYQKAVKFSANYYHMPAI